MASQALVTLPLMKFSSATTSVHARPIPWDHLASGNLRVVFEGLFASQASDAHSSAETRLKIIRSREILVLSAAFKLTHLLLTLSVKSRRISI